MEQRDLRIAIIGAGIGGLALAAALRQNGVRVNVYEQAQRFERLGAGIQMSPNAMRVLRGLGQEPKLRELAFTPPSWKNRRWDSGEMQFELPLGAQVEARYGAPYLLMHRGDLHAALASVVPVDQIHLKKKLVDLEVGGDGVTMRFSDGSRASADAVVAADGIHSRVRELMLGADQPRFTGRIAYRTVFPAALVSGSPVDDCTKWWGEDRHVVIYYVNPRREEIYFVTSVPEDDWDVESYSATGDVRVLREHFRGFHDQVRRVFAACPAVHKWALVDREPLPRWRDRRVVLLGDACHPMTPYMAQGAAMALEDAAMLARCLAASGEIDEAFARFEASRKERTSRVQGHAGLNTWMKQSTDPSWVYDYDVWSVPIADPQSVSASPMQSTRVTPAGATAPAARVGRS